MIKASRPGEAVKEKKEQKGPMKEEKAGKEENKGTVMAVIRLRGEVGLNSKIKDTLYMLRLRRNNSCVILEKTPSNVGMIRKVKDYVTWGEIDGETLKELIEKRAEVNPEDPKKTKPFFRLSPPRHGLGKKGLKASFSNRGALGYRGGKINDLLKRMI